MSELLVRFGANDAALLRRMTGGAPGPQPMRRPDRVVVDAHVPISSPQLALHARRAGIPVVIDPQTYFLQDVQHPQDAWASLPFASARLVTPSDLMSTGALDRLVEACVEYQVTHGATAVVAPYVHLENARSGWIQVQAALWDRTRAFLDRSQLGLPVIAVLAAGWRLLTPVRCQEALAPALAALHELNPAEVGLAASKVHTGTRAEDRVVDFIRAVRFLSRQRPVIAWQQGLLGEVAVVAGASGYETGLGQRERCDLNTAMTSRRSAREANAYGARPVYIAQLKRSLPKRSIQNLQSHRHIWMLLQCREPLCCPSGSQILGDARMHAFTARAHDLDVLSAAARPSWQWLRLETQARAGIDLADRINRIASNSEAINKVDTTALRAIQDVAEVRRQRQSSRHVA